MKILTYYCLMVRFLIWMKLLVFLKTHHQKNKPIVIIAREVEGQALATMVVNSARQTLKCLKQKAPVW